MKKIEGRVAIVNGASRGEERKHNIRVFALSPWGWVPTPGTLYQGLGETMPDVNALLERPEAMRLAAIYLCGEEGRDLSGERFYGRRRLRDRENHGVALVEVDESLFR